MANRRSSKKDTGSKKTPGTGGKKTTGSKKTTATRSKVRRPSEAGSGRHLIILSRRASLYSTRRLMQAARARGHTAQVLDTLRCTMVLRPGLPEMLYRGREV
ncbi:MAG: 30S ribosomal protein S6--L-glutamate ligase, partial [Myxococcota bacterium]